MGTVASQWLTLMLLIGVALFLIVSDVWLIRSRGVDASYSRTMGHLFAQYPVIMAVFVFSVGVLIGHVLLNSHPG